MGETGKDAFRIGFERAIKLEFHGASDQSLDSVGVLYWCPKDPAMEPGKGQMENVGIAL